MFLTLISATSAGLGSEVSQVAVMWQSGGSQVAVRWQSGGSQVAVRWQSGRCHVFIFFG